jgi:hypothetical protein
MPSISPLLSNVQRKNSYDLEKVVNNLKINRYLGMTEYEGIIKVDQYILEHFCDIMTNITIYGSVQIEKITFSCHGCDVLVVSGHNLEHFMIPFCLIKHRIKIDIMPHGYEYRIFGDAMYLSQGFHKYFERLAYYNNIKWMNLYLTYDLPDQSPPLADKEEQKLFKNFIKVIRSPKLLSL